jgi:Putative auto-transporter adhesin, head GIN domain
MRTALIAGVALVAMTGAAHAETRNVTGFTGVAAADRIRVEVTTGSPYRVDVTGSDASRVRTRVEDGTLRIRRTNRPWFGETPPIDATVRVTLPRVESLASSMGADLTANGLTASNLSLAASMGGELSAAGTCTSVDASASMGGIIKAEALQCRDADVSASMGGEARVYASNRFDVSASMGGAVNVAGEGRATDVSLSMGGSLERD